VADYCEHCNEPLGSINSGNLLTAKRLLVLKEGTAPCS
jgi:hypothetical protein